MIADKPHSSRGEYRKAHSELALLKLLNTQALYAHAAVTTPDLVLTHPDTGAVYLTRWAIQRSDFGCMYLHKYDGPDIDSAPHDHPYDFTSIILSGGYTERLYAHRDGAQHYVCTRTLHKGDTATRCSALDAHIITDVLPDTWSLVLGGERTRDWLFWPTDTTPVPWREYVDCAKGNAARPITATEVQQRQAAQDARYEAAQAKLRRDAGYREAQPGAVPGASMKGVADALRREAEYREKQFEARRAEVLKRHGIVTPTKEDDL